MSHEHVFLTLITFVVFCVVFAVLFIANRQPEHKRADCIWWLVLPALVSAIAGFGFTKRSAESSDPWLGAAFLILTLILAVGITILVSPPRKR